MRIAAPVNAAMQKRAYQVSEYTFTSLPQKPEEIFEPAPAAAAAPTQSAAGTSPADAPATPPAKK